MRNNLVYLYPDKRVEFVVPPGAAPSDQFQPIRIYDDSLLDLDIRKDDLLAANLSLSPLSGQFSLLKTLQENLLGFYFDKQLRLEMACSEMCCTSRYFLRSEIVVAAPVVRVYRCARGVTYNFAFKEIRGQAWNDSDIQIQAI